MLPSIPSYIESLPTLLQVAVFSYLSEPSDQSSTSPESNFNTKGAKSNRFENLESDFWERRKLNAKNSKPDASLKWISASANVQQEPVNSKTGHEPVSVLEKEKGEEKVSKATQKSESEVKFVQPKHRAGWLMPDEDNNAT